MRHAAHLLDCSPFLERRDEGESWNSGLPLAAYLCTDRTGTELCLELELMSWASSATLQPLRLRNHRKLFARAQVPGPHSRFAQMQHPVAAKHRPIL
ncbi:hypothetical protein ACLKA6_006358 [Drosophila palustris]